MKDLAVILSTASLIVAVADMIISSRRHRKLELRESAIERREEVLENKVNSTRRIS